MWATKDLPPFPARPRKREIGHPGICPLMWHGCVLTKFAGPIDAHDMTADLRFTWKPFTPRQEHLYTVSGATGFALVIFLSLAGVWLFLSMLVCSSRIMRPAGGSGISAKCSSRRSP